MRINNSYIPDQPKLPLTHSDNPSLSPTENHQKAKLARDSYNKNAASAPIIDAEYVDLYGQETGVLKPENQSQYLTLETEGPPLQQKFKSGQNNNSILSRYQMAPIDTPPPGTYLNVFA